MKLTKTTIDRLPTPDSGQVLYRDDTLKGFGLRVTAGAKAFIVEKRIDGKVKRITLGKFGELTAEQARKEAAKLMGEIAQGRDPVAEKKEVELKAKTLGEVFHDYLEARKELKPKTVADYSRALNLHFADWMKRPFTAITKDMVQAAPQADRRGARRGIRQPGNARVARSLQLRSGQVRRRQGAPPGSGKPGQTSLPGACLVSGGPAANGHQTP